MLNCNKLLYTMFEDDDSILLFFNVWWKFIISCYLFSKNQLLTVFNCIILLSLSENV